MAKVAILILNFNGRDLLLNFLPSVIEYAADCQIIVGDNGSTDDSIAILENSFPTVKIIKLDKNFGYAEGYNQCINQVDAEYVALVNSDVEVTPSWTKPLIALLDSSPEIVAVQPKILSYKNKTQFEYAGASGGFLDSFGYPFCRGRIFNTVEEDKGQYTSPYQIFWASGACFMIKKSVFIEANCFDKEFFAHMEEIDLCWRLNSLGYKIMFTGDSTVYHLGAGTLKYASSRKTYLNFRNSLMMLLKNIPRQFLFKTFFIRWWLDLLSVLFYLAKLQPLNANAVIMAHWYILLNAKKIKSASVVHTQSKQIKSGLSPMKISLVWQYYIKGRRKYSDLVPD